MHTIKPSLLIWSVIVCLMTAQTITLSGQDDGLQHSKYKLYVYNIDINSPENAPVITVECDIANTGYVPVRFERSSADSNLIYTKLLFEEGPWKDSLSVLEDAFYCALSQKKLNLEKGAYQKDITLTLIPDTGINRFRCNTSDREKHQTFTPTDTLSKYSKRDTSSKSCYDLVLDSLVIRKQTKHKTWVSYSMYNRGTDVFETDTDKKDLAIKYYLSGSDELTRGSIPLGGVYLEPPRREKLRINPGSSFRGELELDLRNKSRYLNYLILELDPFSNYRECNENNNITVLFLDE